MTSGPKIAVASIVLVNAFFGQRASAADCAQCHPAEAKLHAQSAHASSLLEPVGSAFATHLPDKPLSEASDGYSFTYQRTLNGIEATAQRGSDRATAPIAWIFGSGRQGQTPVLNYAGTFIEHRVSFYVATGFGVTIGQENGVSASSVKALGWSQTISDARQCFHCHSTAASEDLRSLTPGVQCIRCHSGAEEHANGKGLPVNPGKLEHAAQVRLCGECHRVKAPSGNDSNIGNVRFQPLRLMKSACFRRGDIKCTTCHPAHRNAERDAPEVYNRQCRECHADKAAHIAEEKSNNCISCHMPKVSPIPSLTFTDHFIRIVANRR